MKSKSSAPHVPVKLVTCPTCGCDSVYAAANPFRPFCSERCKNIDLGAWASESFRMPATGLPEDQIADDEPRSSASH
jgi:endogenous inhibitor of DNA gyrase (YacG/DUF329 family)